MPSLISNRESRLPAASMSVLLQSDGGLNIFTCGKARRSMDDKKSVQGVGRR